MNLETILTRFVQLAGLAGALYLTALYLTA